MVAAAWVGTHEALRRLLWENPTFFLTDVRVTTDGTLTREQIINAGGVVLGSNIFTVEPERVRAALQRLPQVDRVDVQRSFPHRVDIEVEERQPVAWLTEQDVDPSASDRSFLVDARGYVMKSRKLLPEYLHLPIISGVEVENLAPGQKAAALPIHSALELLRLNADSTRWQVRNIDVAKQYCMVVTDRTHAQITFGLEDIDKQLTKLNRLLDYVEPTHREIQTVNLLVERNTPVTFFEPEVEAPPAPAVPAKPDAKSAPVVPKGKERSTPTPTPAPRTKDKPDKPGTHKSKEGVKKPFRLNG
jgi:cell division protein FtsQ